MKKVKVGLLALSFIAGGIIAGSAAKQPNTGSSTDIVIDFGSNAPSVYYVDGVPVPTGNENVTVGFNIVSTDGAGKIEGVAYMNIDFTDGTNVNGSAQFIVDVSGKIGNKGDATSANITLKGNGFATDSSNTVSSASLSLKFVGSPAGTNDTLVGTLNGTIKLGTKTITGATTVKVKDTAASVDAFSSSFNVFARIVEFNDKLWAAGAMVGEQVPVSGTGNLNAKKNTFTANLKGVAYGRGSSAKLSGTTSTATNAIVIIGTNEVPVTIVIPAQVEANGKVLGQKVSATGGTTSLTE